MDFKETAFDMLSSDSYGTISTSERKWITKILKMHQERPDEVQIITMPDNNSGMLIAHIPKKCFKISWPKTVNYSEEQKEAAAERMRIARSKKGANN